MFGVLFQGVLIDAKELVKIRKILQQFPFFSKFIPVLKKEVHMTCAFRPRKEEIYSNDLLGKSVVLHVTAIGVLRDQNGDVTNLGLRIEDTSNLSNNDVAHVTIFVGNGGRAVDTAKCDWVQEVDFCINGRFAVFDKASHAAFRVAA